VFLKEDQVARRWNSRAVGKCEPSAGYLKDPLFMKFAIPISREGDPLFQQV
jgi:hypothetical protein